MIHRSNINVAGCIVEHEDKILLLHRAKNDGNIWGLPSGSIDAGEDHITAAARELFEETGIKVKVSDLVPIGRWQDRQPHRTVRFTGFRVRLTERPSVTLSALEHDEFAWLTPKECTKRKLIHTLKRILRDTGYLEKFQR